MDPLIRIARRLAVVGVWIGGSVIVAAALLTGAEVLMRKLLNISTGGADEIAGFALAIGTAWSLPLALLDRAHIRIDSLYARFPARLIAVLDIAGLLAFLVFFGTISWFGYGVFATSLKLGAVSQSAIGVPLIWPQGLWVAGLVLFVLTCLVLLVRALGLLIKGDHAAITSLIGSRTLEEETKEELLDLARRSRG